MSPINGSVGQSVCVVVKNTLGAVSRDIYDGPVCNQNSLSLLLADHRSVGRLPACRSLSNIRCYVRSYMQQERHAIIYYICTLMRCVYVNGASPSLFSTTCTWASHYKERCVINLATNKGLRKNGSCLAPGNGQVSPINSLKRPINQVSAEQPHKTKRMIKYLPSNPTQRNERPTFSRAITRDGAND